MYASSFVLALDQIEATLERALAIETFQDSTRALRVAADAIDAIEDIGELSSIALPNVAIDALERTDGDEAIRTILTDRLEAGLDVPLDEDVLGRARETGRITEAGGRVIVPVGEQMPALRNWWLLADLLSERLDRVVDGFRRVHQRTRTDATDRVETVFWTVRERLGALADAFSSALVVGRYTRRSARQGTSALIDGVATIATAVTGGGDA